MMSLDSHGMDGFTGIAKNAFNWGANFDRISEAYQTLIAEETTPRFASVLQLTTNEGAENRLVTRVYPVPDLVLPIQDLSFAGLGGLSGGAADLGFGSRTFGRGQNGQPGQQDQPLGDFQLPFDF